MCSFRFLCMSVLATMRSNSPNRLIPLKLSPDYFSTDRASSRSVAVEEIIVNKHKLLESLLLLSLKFRYISFKIYWVVVNLCPKLKALLAHRWFFIRVNHFLFATYHSSLLEAQITAIGWASGHWRNWNSLNGTSNNITNTEAIMRARWDVSTPERGPCYNQHQNTPFSTFEPFWSRPNLVGLTNSVINSNFICNSHICTHKLPVTSPI